MYEFWDHESSLKDTVCSMCQGSLRLMKNVPILCDIARMDFISENRNDGETVLNTS